ncbi:acyltransferase [Massilia sp. Dwa41.01b]|uniref:acyltransferase family protein n=1 Tax=unclassified Massilia TaxID=2609279 RepID=UPI001600B87E|nr:MULTISPECIES: acyltransferase [unclassified Massilia]QNA89614.1 acyltransferase [Massilia sp. Dwa41.01b]QNB00511.1 acyltransferase [Massilia sp. Se16.2.3]
MVPPPPPLSRALSLYLDCCRLLAAVLVVASHLEPYGVIADGNAWWLKLGREAVIVFFVLSGFVIAYTTEQKNPTLRDYCLARCTRIYSVALPLLLLAFGAAAFLSLAKQAQFYQLAKPWLYLPLHLLFMGELWTISEPPPLLAPYWSLGYEVWYYVLFGALFYLRGRRRLVAATSVLLFVGPKLWLLLPVWASGVLLYRWQRSETPAHTLARPLALLGWCATLALLVLFKLSDLDTALRAYANAHWPFPGLPLKSADRVLADYLVCLLVLANFLCAKSVGFTGLLRVEKPIRALASYTFTLYLVHALVMRLWLILYAHQRSDPVDVSALIVLIVASTWVIGHITEQRKAWFGGLFARLAARPT